jgi:type II secretory pathway component PulF
MPIFSYSAINDKGQTIRGRMPAQSEPNLEEKLRSAGRWLLEAKLEKPSAGADAAKQSRQGWRLTGRRTTRRDLIEFCTLMTFQTRVGVPLVTALNVASQDCENPHFRQILGGLKSHIERGLLFHEALGKYPAVFSPHFVSVVRAGENSSKLPETFADQRDYLQWMERIIADVRQASLYPAILLTVMTGFVLFLFSSIIPKFADLLTSLKVPLPLLTQIIFGLGTFCKATWWIWLPGLLLLVIGVLAGRRYSKRMAFFLDDLKLRLPILGKLNWMLAMSRFTHNLSVLYGAGIIILNALKLCQSLVGNLVVEKALKEVTVDVEEGMPISEAMRKHPIFPPMLLRMVVMGETTGSLATALDNVAGYYNEIIPREIKKVFAVLEPMLMLFIIGLVGCVALAIYMPILSLMGAVR